jgi:5-methylcytosine-specific restriction endonuclease McrA
MKHAARRLQLKYRFVDQGGLCFYCLRTTYLPEWDTPKSAAIKLGVPISLIAKRMATREHLRRRTEGGGDYIFNIVMACQECNVDRGERSVLDHVKAKRQEHRPRGLVFANEIPPPSPVFARASA